MLLEGKAEGPGVVSWEEFLAAGEPSHEAEVARRRAALTGDSPTTLIYTSGTTGTPKGVMLTQRQPRLHRREDPGARADRHRRLADQLPAALAHRRAGRLAPAARSRRAPRSTSPRASRSCPSTCARCGRTFFFGVPRVWEKMQAAIEAKGARGAPAAPKNRGAGRARSACVARRRRPGAAGPGPGATGSPTGSCFSKVRERLGLRPRALLRGLGGADRARDARVLPRPRPADLRGLRHERVHAGRRRCRFPARYRLGSAGYAIPGTELQHRRGRRDPDPRPARLPRLLQGRGGHRARRSTPTAGCTRATWASSTRTASCASPTARRS